MAKTTITEREALSLLAETFAEPVENIRPEVERAAIQGWDSMGALMLMAELDERFSLELTADTSKNMQRVADVLEFLRQHGVLQS
jgi:acyl carrier protein